MLGLIKIVRHFVCETFWESTKRLGAGEVAPPLAPSPISFKTTTKEVLIEAKIIPPSFCSYIAFLASFFLNWGASEGALSLAAPSLAPQLFF